MDMIQTNLPLGCFWQPSNDVIVKLICWASLLSLFFQMQQTRLQTQIMFYVIEITPTSPKLWKKNKKCKEKLINTIYLIGDLRTKNTKDRNKWHKITVIKVKKQKVSSPFQVYVCVAKTMRYCIGCGVCSYPPHSGTYIHPPSHPHLSPAQTLLHLQEAVLLVLYPMNFMLL